MSAFNFKASYKLEDILVYGMSAQNYFEKGTPIIKKRLGAFFSSEDSSIKFI